jgi:Leucine-rich repeat (LRR) protein
MQRTCFLLVISLAFQFAAQAQCVECFSLEEAMRAPEKVKSLTLRAKSLTEIPAEVNQLVNLESLDLSGNLIWELKPERLHLPALQGLNMSNNPGMLVLDLESIGTHLPALKSLDVSHSALRHIGKDIDELENLESLNLAGNQIEFLPEVFAQFKHLRKIDVSDNRLKDAIWLNNCWNLEALHIQNNPDVNLDELGLSLLEKDHLSTIQLTPNGKGVPAIFASLPIKELHLSGGAIEALNGRLRLSDSLRSLVIEDCQLLKPKSFFEVLNNCRNIRSLEFADTEVPAEITLAKGLDDLYFDNCTFKSVSELRKIRPQTDIHAVNCDIASEDFVGNSRIARTIEVQNESVSEEMLTNQVESIISPAVKIQTVNAQEESRIDLGFSSYEIPVDAFLQEDGSVYQGEVSIRVKEYNDPIITALDGVPMVYQDGNQNEIFTSSGMIDFRAYDEQGSELKPNPENPIEVSLLDVQPDGDNRLYALNDSTNQWQDIGAPKSTNWDSLRVALMDSLNLLPDSLFFNYRVVYPNFEMNYKRQRKSPDELSFVAYNTMRFNRNFYKVPGSMIRASGQNQLWVGRRKIWMIDTLLTKEQRDQLAQIAARKGDHDKFWKLAKKTGNGKLLPRVIYNLSLTPNLDHDNFTLRFMYKDQEVKLPVYESWESSVSRTQQREKKMEKAYGKARRQAEKEQKYIDAHLDDFEERTVAANRAQIADNTITLRMMALAVQNQLDERLRFGLSSFGLINCDRFRNQPPPSYYALVGELKDQNENYVKIPETVRVVYLNENAYMEVPSQNVPYYNGASVRLVFKLSETELAVGSEDLFGLGTNVKRINTQDYSPEEIYNLIRNL